MKKLFAALLALCMVFSLSAVALAEDTVNIYALKGPTGIGMVQIMAENDGTYAFTLAGAPDEVVAAVASGNADHCGGADESGGDAEQEDQRKCAAAGAEHAGCAVHPERR